MSQSASARPASNKFARGDVEFARAKLSSVSWRSFSIWSPTLCSVPARAWIMMSSIIPESDHRVDMRGSPRRNITGDERDNAEQKNNAGKGRRVGWPGSEQ